MLKYAFLGIIQGLTEFLPVSSSGHLAILQKLLALKGQEITLSIVLHLGTLLALLIFFFKDILKLFRDARTLSLIIVSTLITGIIGISAKDFLERLFSLPQYIAVGFIFTGLILMLTKNFLFGLKKDLNLKDAVIFGLSQGLAIIPGVSRSGLTISAFLFRGINRIEAFRFSFLASIPAILGAVILEYKKINFVMQLDAKNFIIGLVFSFLSGLLSLWFLKKIIARAGFFYFGYYCLAIGILTLLFIR